MKKIISSILVVATLIGCLAALPLGALALDNGGVIVTVPITDPSVVTNAIANQNYANAQEKLDNDPNMVKYVTVGSMELWANVYSGEVYVKDNITGQILNSNPYSLSDIASGNKNQLMSQLVINYTTSSASDAAGSYLYSFNEAAARGQITLTATKDGIRMDYILGDTTKRYAMPYGIMAQDFLDKVMAPLQKQTWELIYNTVKENGVPEEDLQSVYDFEAFCNERIELYGTYEKYGKEYTFGNSAAFDRWCDIALSHYSTFYRTHKDSNPGMTRPEYVEKLRDDFLAINQVYIEKSAYKNSSRDRKPYHESWELLSSNLKDFPVLAEKEDGDEYYKNTIFVLDTSLTSRQLRQREAIFKQYASDYTMEDVYAAEERTGISPMTVDNPVFYASLVYTLTEDGLKVSLPATSLVYDESKYIVNFVSVLPYFGTGRVADGGYIFYPDGSGAIVKFEDYETSHATLQGNVYGQDYAYYSITGKHQEVIRMPVFGTVKDTAGYFFKDPYDASNAIACTKQQYTDAEYVISYELVGGKVYAVYPYGRSEEPVTVYYNEAGRKVDIVTDPNQEYLSDKTPNPNYYKYAKTVVTGEENFFRGEKTDVGFAAIITEGAALAELRLSLAPDAQNPYSSVCACYTPRAKDSYDLVDSISSISSSATYTVLSDKKYLGSYTTEYIMLHDDKLAAAAGMLSYYPASYVGMAAAYQQYLIDEGVLTALENLQDQLPLVIESFGVIQSTKKVMSIPFTVDVALTTFDDIKTMYQELSDKGISNVKFRLTGFINGGMTSTYPVKLKWEQKAGGKSGYKDLLAYAKSVGGGLEIFPNVNFTYVQTLGRFDGINLKKIGARSVDNRYAMRKTYDSVYQTYVSNGGIVVSANHLTDLFAKFNRKNTKYGNTAISLDYVASDLATDFNEDNLLTREDSMQYVTDYLKTVRESGYSSIMSVGGNAYALKYMDYLLEVPVSSSYFRATSNSVPFWGMVMHGYVNYTGEAFNEQANKSEALLRAIESGASLYFLLSYDNTRLLKDDKLLSEYYSVNYQISKDTVETYYKLLNEAIGDLQSYRIVNHRSVNAERVGLAADVTAQRLTLQEEFMQQLADTVLQSKEEERNLIKAMIKLSESFTGSSYEDLSDFVPGDIGKFISNYSSNPRIAAVLGDDTNPTSEEEHDRARRKIYDAIVSGTLSTAYGQSIGVQFDTDAVLASAKYALFTDTLDADFEAQLKAYMAANNGAGCDVVAQVADIEYQSAYRYFTYSKALDSNYVATESTVSDGTVVMVTYSNGEKTVHFLLNFNIFSVTVSLDGHDTVTLGKYGFLRLDD